MTMRLVDGRARLHLAVPASAAVITARKLADNLAKADRQFKSGATPNASAEPTLAGPAEAHRGARNAPLDGDNGFGTAKNSELPSGASPRN